MIRIMGNLAQVNDLDSEPAFSMPKKKSKNLRLEREKHKLRMREKRLKKTTSKDSPQDQSLPSHSLSCGSVDEAVAVSTTIFPVEVPMGFPLFEKPLARVQASLCEKMYSPAPRLPSPRGSRLFVREQDKAPSPDSPPWVCAPPRAPGPDTVHVSGPAGQAQLETSMDGGTSRKLKDEGYKNDSLSETERNINRNIVRKKTNIHDNTIFRAKGNETVHINASQSREGQPHSMSICNRSIQGSFHQGDIMFGENAGTQCVANCLGALAYHKIKSSNYWDESDMNRVLIMGNELYMYLQRSSTITSRYLLVSELPQFIECFDKMYEFKCNESLPSLIGIGNEEPCYEDFNAHRLLDAQEISLSNTDGCFVCFGGNTILVGKMKDNYFIFDSHSRTQEGYQTADGKSIRIIHNSILDIQQHIWSLALSMGYDTFVDCEITGVVCSMMHVEHASNREIVIQDDENYDRAPHELHNDCQRNPIENPESNESILYISEEGNKLADEISVESLMTETKRRICHELNVKLLEKEQILNATTVEIAGKKLQCQQIKGDGNCFFRAVSYCVSGSEENHEQIRQATCRYLLKNEYQFKSFQRNVGISMNDYLIMSKMTESGTWATELEIFGVASLLNIDVYTFSCSQWLLYSGRQVYGESAIKRGSIFLHHLNDNHYNVLSMVCKDNKEVHSECRGFPKMENYRRRLVERKEKYRQNPEYRENVLDRKRQTYQTDPRLKKFALQSEKKRYGVYRTRILNKRREKYSTCLQFKEEKIEAGKRKYMLNSCHRESMKKKSICKYRSNSTHRKSVKDASISKYKINKEHRQHVKELSMQKYKSDPVLKSAVKENNRNRYKNDAKYQMQKKQYEANRYKTNEYFRNDKKTKSAKRYRDDDLRDDMLETKRAKYASDEQIRIKKREQSRNNRRAAYSKLLDETMVVNLFQEKSKHSPEYICCCCHRLLFFNQVQTCDLNMYESRNNNSKEVAEICIQKDCVHCCSTSCRPDCNRSSLWICKTCHRKILSGKIPAEAVVNKMKLESMPNELKDLNSLERQLIALHIPFMKVTHLPQGKQKNIHGPVVCVPIDLKKTSSLPRTTDESMVLRVKLKRKLSYKGYQEYQFVNPHHVVTALNFLMENNAWYKDVQIDTNWESKTNFDDCLTEKDITKNIPEEQDPPEDDLKDLNTSVILDSCLQPVDVVQEVFCHYFDDVFNLAPGEGKNPVKMLQDEGNEAKTFPCLFPSGHNSWNESRDIKITLSRYFHNRLMNADNRFAKDSNYIFFSQYMSELNQVIEKTQISVRKSFQKTSSGKSVTPGMLQDPDLLSKMINNNEAIRFMQPIRGTPSYWQTAQKDLFAMLRQIGIPTWFCSFSAAEFRWHTTIEAILRQQSDNRPIDEMDWTEKSEIRRSNPVTVARMFEHRFHIFMRDVIMGPSEPIGKVVDYFQRVEFQQRGSPHMHCLFWIDGAPKLEQDGEIAVCNFVDKYVTCEIPSESEDAHLNKTVLDVQQHSKKHSQSCRKKGTECRFNFPRPPSEKTFITKPFDKQDLNDGQNSNLGVGKNNAKEILQKVWDEIQDPANEIFSCEHMFDKLGLTQETFEEAYNAVTSKQTIVLQRNPNEIWTNQYNPCLLNCWDANLDIQFVLDPFSCIVYIISYISKSEREMGLLLKQTAVEAEGGNLSARQTLKKVGSAYLHHREVSAQEAVYRVCNLRMKECSRKTVFIPVGENPTRLSKPLHNVRNNVEEDDEDEMWMTNIVERYENRPNKKEFANMCLAQFCSKFRVLAKSQVPNTTKDGVYELKNGKGYVQKRVKTNPAIIRYPRFSKEKMAEKYYQSILQLFLPYWNQDQLKPPSYELYQTFYESGHVCLKWDKTVHPVRDIVNSNRQIYCQNEDTIKEAEETFDRIGEPEDAWALLCPETETNRRSCLEHKIQVVDVEGESDVPDLTEDGHNADIIYQIQPLTPLRKDMLPLLRSLNKTQSDIFYFIRDWCLQKTNGAKPQPFHIFVTGGAGTGKSHLIKTVHYEAERVLSKSVHEPGHLTVLLTALTGTAAFNIGGTTIHHAFALNKYMPFPYEPLQEQRLNAIRVKLQNLQILVIDEISMVYKRLLYYVHERLVQIKKNRLPFGGVSVVAVGDFFQLPPVKQKKTERLYHDNVSYPEDFWTECFKLVELTEVMRQSEDLKFSEMLNRIRTRTKEEILEPALIEDFRECIRQGPDDVLHVFATNDEVNDYNLSMLKRSCVDLIEINAKDYQKDKTSGKLRLRENSLVTKRSEGLSSCILIGLNARIMLTRNVDVEDGLVNGVVGRITNIKLSTNHTNEITGISVAFDNQNVGKKVGKRNESGILEVTIERVEEEINGKGKQKIIRHQFPLQLAWACTAHKVQGMTTNEVVVNLDKVFAPGQAYVALSRVTSKNGLHIETSYDDICDLFKRKVYAEQDVQYALSQMENLITNQISTNDVHSKTIILHNIQSLPAHFGDLKTERRFQNANVICLTETWLQKQENRGFQLENFSCTRKDRFDSYDTTLDIHSNLKHSKGGGVVIYSEKKEQTTEIAVPVRNIEISAIHFEQKIAILTVYRPISQPCDLFLSSLKDVIHFVKKNYDRVIVLGDFNENTDTLGPIQKYMCKNGFTQYVSFPTTEGGTSIDHVYGYGLQPDAIDVSLLPIYYSYHEAVIVKVKFDDDHV